MVIFKTINLITGDSYIGKDVHNDPFYLGSGINLKRAISEFGKHNFKKEIIEICYTLDQLKERETYWIKYYDAVYSKNYYNLTTRSSGGTVKTGSKKWINNPITNKFKMVDSEKLQEYLDNGWVKSSPPKLPGSSTKGNKWIHDPTTGKIRNVNSEKLKLYLETGWVLGLGRELGCIKIK